MSRGGLQPRRMYFYSSEGNTFKSDPQSAIPLPNLSGALHNVLRQYIDFYGLGKKCLLVSESNGVKAILQKNNYQHTVEDDPYMGSVEVWVKTCNN